jgi:hypothetical protein
MYILYFDHGGSVMLHNQEDESLIRLEAVGRCEEATVGGTVLAGDEDGSTLYGVVMPSVGFESYMAFTPRANAS